MLALLSKKKLYAYALNKSQLQTTITFKSVQPLKWRIKGFTFKKIDNRVH